jgi:isochorismate hydrolase
MNKHPNILDRDRAALVIVDLQESFREVIPDFAALAERIATLARGAQILGVPVLVTEQYPRGLGKTASEITAVLNPDTPVFEKTAFSSCGAESFTDHLASLARDQILLCGIEAHICINQTAHDLLAGNRQVHLVTDCIGARSERNRAVALRKMRGSGALLSTVEMALFEMLGDARDQHFKSIQALIR